MAATRSFVIIVSEDTYGNKTVIISGKSFFERKIIPRIRKQRVPYKLAYTLSLSNQHTFPVYTITTNNGKKEFIDELFAQIAREFKHISMTPVRILTSKLYLKHKISKLPQCIILKLLMQGLILAKTTDGEYVIFA